jgi:hypothetical protein
MEEEVERRRRQEEEAQRTIEAEQEGEKRDDGGEKSSESAVANESGEKPAVERDVSAAIDEDTKVAAETGLASAEATLPAASGQVEQ